MARVTALVILVLLGTFVYSKDIQVDSSTPGSKVITTNSLIIKIEGEENVPMFTYQQVNSSTRYKVIFQQAYQVQNISHEFDNNKVPESTISLQSYKSWSFSDVVTLNDNQDNETILMNITSTGSNIPTFQFRIHINATSASLKFDTVIDEMRNVWQSSATGFAICYRLKHEGSDDSSSDVSASTEDHNKRLGFGSNSKAFISIVPTAIDNTNKTINALLKPSSDGLACVIYEKFDNTLVHDPELGITSTPWSASGSITTWSIFSILIFAIALL